MRHYQFECIGLDGYAGIREEIHGILYRAFFGQNYAFIQAMEKAVENAARYSIDADNAHILLALRVMTRNIAVTVSCRTKVFDAFAFRKTLRNLVKDPIVKEMDWGAYIRQEDTDAGIWYMLIGSEYLCMDAQGQSVTMVARRSILPIDITENRIGLLVSRFLIKQNGVVF